MIHNVKQLEIKLKILVYDHHLFSNGLGKLNYRRILNNCGKIHWIMVGACEQNSGTERMMRVVNRECK